MLPRILFCGLWWNKGCKENFKTLHESQNEFPLKGHSGEKSRHAILNYTVVFTNFWCIILNFPILSIYDLNILIR